MKKSALALLITAAIAGSPAVAETISGIVKDSQGKPVAQAEIKINGSANSALSDSDGRFVLTDVPASHVELHLSARRFEHTNVHLTVPATGLHNVELTLQSGTFEIIDVTATPLHTSVTESALPVSVLSGDKLKMQQAATLGDTLSKQVGVHSNFYGGVSSAQLFVV